MEMNEDKPRIPGDHDQPEPGLTPDPALSYREGDIIHTAPEFALADADVLAAERGDVIAGTSSIREAFEQGSTLGEIQKTWVAPLNEFIKVRERYLLY